jgi:superoxide dismutase, Fe-Mn family
MFTIQKPTYAYDALEPYIDAQTMKIHTEKHHQGYADKLNSVLEPHSDLQSLTLEQLLTETDHLPVTISSSVKNFAGGVHNHDAFWTMLSTKPDQAPPDQLAEAITSAFNGLADFKTDFSDQAAALFGSGWVWLVKDTNKTLSIITTANQDSPLSLGYLPLLGLDVWEHAYYLKYQNKRPEYIEAFWHVVNWAEVARRYAARTDADPTG